MRHFMILIAAGLLVVGVSGCHLLKGGGHSGCTACAAGKEGKTVWCDGCSKGFVDGKSTGCAACFKAKQGGPACEACAAKKKDS